jgi:hypothetical protein
VDYGKLNQIKKLSNELGTPVRFYANVETGFEREEERLLNFLAAAERM